MDVTGITAAKATAIENASVVSGYIAPLTGHLMLVTKGGTEIDAGQVVPDPPAPPDLSGLVKDAEFNSSGDLILTRHDNSQEVVEEPVRIRASWELMAFGTEIPTSMTFDDTVLNLNETGGFEKVSNTVRVPLSGMYLIATTVFVVSGTGTGCRLFVKRDGSHIGGGMAVDVVMRDASGAGVNFCTAIPLSAGDRISFSVDNNGGAPLTLSPNRVSLTRIGA